MVIVITAPADMMRELSMFLLLWVAALLFRIIEPAFAETEKGIAVTGVVRDDVSHTGIAAAHIRFDGGEGDVVSGSSGCFTVKLPAGKHRIVITREGYFDYADSMIVNHAETLDRVFFMKPREYRVDEITVSAEETDDESSSLRHEQVTLAGARLQREMAVTLAETVKNQAGASMRSMGPAPARPVIRGQSGARILIGQNGLVTSDVSGTAPDHAVTVEPFTADRIDIIRGPRLLLFTSNAMGGMINVQNNAALRRVPLKMNGSLGFLSQSACPGALGSLSMTIPVKTAVLYGDYTGKHMADERTPEGRLENTAIDNTAYTAGLSYIKGKGYYGIRLDEYSSEYGIPGGFIGGHPKGVDIDMLRRSMTAESVLPVGKGQVRTIELQLSRTYYSHTEYESNHAVGAEFLQTEYVGRALVDLAGDSSSQHTNACLTLNSRNLKMGGYVFTAPTRALSFAAAVYHQRKWRGFDVEGSARFGYDCFEPHPKERISAIGSIRDRSLLTFATSVSAVHQLTQSITSGVTVSRSSRCPTIEELYNEGPHLAAYSYETGNPGLGTEHGCGAELFLSFEHSRFSTVTTIFANDMSSYIAFRNTGEINWRQILPIYRADAVTARFFGIEHTMRIPMGRWMYFNGTFDYVYGQNRSDGIPLPMMPPLKGVVEAVCERGMLTATLKTEWAADQDRLDTFETATDGYIIFSPGIQITFHTNGTIHRLTCAVENVADTAYRNHLSRIKTIMPETGRNAVVKYVMYF